TIDRGDYPTARNHLKRLLPLFQACFVESNPIPVKGGAGILGLMEPRYRLPITPPAPETLEAMRRALQPFMS
ncbi:MAG: dihydrodipicolinate synthase family protein, partial [Deltaproteobacteria bacterium]|nr:dihydrodipicolinate synthase family protein [Deltaproteobacteria bacterium]